MEQWKNSTCDKLVLAATMVKVRNALHNDNVTKPFENFLVKLVKNGCSAESILKWMGDNIDKPNMNFNQLVDYGCPAEIILKTFSEL